jgi:hypothetical protein
MPSSRAAATVIPVLTFAQRLARTVPDLLRQDFASSAIFFVSPFAGAFVGASLVAGFGLAVFALLVGTVGRAFAASAKASAWSARMDWRIVGRDHTSRVLTGRHSTMSIRDRIDELARFIDERAAAGLPTEELEREAARELVLECRVDCYLDHIGRIRSAPPGN